MILHIFIKKSLKLLKNILKLVKFMWWIEKVITTFNSHKIIYLSFIIFKYIISLECDLMDKYNLKELEDVSLDDVDEISSIKIDRRKLSNEKYWILLWK